MESPLSFRDGEISPENKNIYVQACLFLNWNSIFISRYWKFNENDKI